MWPACLGSKWKSLPPGPDSYKFKKSDRPVTLSGKKKWQPVKKNGNIGKKMAPGQIKLLVSYSTSSV